MSATHEKPIAAGAASVRVPEIMHGDVLVRAETFNKDARTVEIIWAAGALVKRYSWDEGYYMEELSMDPKHIRMERFATGMSLLDSHASQSMANRIGTIVVGSAKVAGGKGTALVKLSRNELGEQILSDLADGHPFQVSVGYRTHAYEKREGDENTLPVLRAIDWEPYELSVVPIPADAGAHSRNEVRTGSPVEVAIRPQNRKSNPMDEDDILEVPGVNETKRHLEIRRLESAERVAEERRAASERIKPKAVARRAFAERFPVTGLDVEAFVTRTEGMNENQVRNALLEAAVDQQDSTSTFPAFNVEAIRRTGEHAQSELDAMADAQMVRMDSRHVPSERARQYVGLSTIEMARHCLERAGVRTAGMQTARLLETALTQRGGMHTTSDFTYVLTTGSQVKLQRDYPLLISPLIGCFRAETAQNFKEISRLQIGGSADLLKVNEHGEYKSGPIIGEGKESYRIETYGRLLKITRQALINDDLGALQRVQDTLPRSAADFVSQFLVNLLETNPRMADNKAVFHADHKNLASTGAPLGVVTIDRAMLAVEKQTGVDGRTVYQKPRYLVVPSELRLQARALLAQIQASRTEDYNPIAGSLELIVDPRLKDPLAWYVAADPGIHPGAEYAYLAGAEGPQVQTRDGWEVDGIELKIRLDFGAGWVDWRGWFKNPGAAS